MPLWRAKEAHDVCTVLRRPDAAGGCLPTAACPDVVVHPASVDWTGVDDICADAEVGEFLRCREGDSVQGTLAGPVSNVADGVVAGEADDSSNAMLAAEPSSVLPDHQPGCA
jgi:hypothetical protein